MPVLAPDVVIASNLAPPTGMTVAQGRSLVVETVNRAGLTARALSGGAQLTPVDGYGARSGAATALPTALPTSGRVLIEHTGDTNASTPLQFA